MKKKPWLKPVIVTVLVTALGLAGAVVGASFAQPSTELVPTGIVPATVIQAVSIGEAPAADLGTDPDAPIDVSRAVGQRDVILPTESTDLDPVIRTLIEEIGDAVDPIFDLILLDRDAELENAGGDDDPCAPRSGHVADSESADCPDGLMSTVLGLTGLVEFRAGGQAWPPTREHFIEHGNPTGGSIWCDPGETGISEEHDTLAEVPLGIVSTAPGTFTVRYWPSARPGEVSVKGGIRTNAEGNAQWEAYLADPDDPDNYPLLRHCLALTELEPDTAYTGVVSGTDIGGRVSSPHTIRFHTSGAPVHPGAHIVTIGENLVLVSALHRRNEAVDIRLAVSDAADAGDSCSAIGARSGLTPLTTVAVDVTPDDVAAANAPTDFLRKQVTSFAVPEGTTALLCARWYAAGSAPSWQRLQPLFESSAILQSPDRVLPSLSLTDVSPYARGLERMRVVVSSIEGAECGRASWGRESGELPLPVCVGESALDRGGAGTDGRDRLFDRGASGDLVVTLTAVYDDARETETRVVIASTDRGCRGSCELPPDAYYRVALATVDQPAGLCGSSFGDCTPPTRTVAGGSAELLVTWSQGAANGMARWNQTATVDLAPDYVQPDVPQFDLNERWTFSAPTFRPGYGTIPFESVTGSFLLRVDRPIDYTMSFIAESTGEVGERCDSTGGPLVVEGRVERAGTITMPGACLRAGYYGELTLRDDDGNSATWSVIDRTHFWGGGGVITAPGLETTLHYNIAAQGYMRSSLAQFRFSVGGWDAGAVDTRSGRCTEDGIVQSQGSFPVVLGPTETVYLVIQLNVSSSWSPDSCARTLEDGPSQIVSVPVTLAELYGGDSVVITAPDPYGVRITLRAERP